MAWERQLIVLEDLLRPVHFVPEAAKAVHVLRDLQRRRTQIAVVVDEHGGVAGLLTLEDLVEELVGDIFGETEQPEALSQPEPDGTALVRGEAPIREVNRALALDLPEGEDYTTVAGLCIALAGAVPERGARLRARGRHRDRDRRRLAPPRARSSGSGHRPRSRTRRREGRKRGEASSTPTGCIEAVHPQRSRRGRPRPRPRPNFSRPCVLSVAPPQAARRRRTKRRRDDLDPALRPRPRLRPTPLPPPPRAPGAPASRRELPPRHRPAQRVPDHLVERPYRVAELALRLRARDERVERGGARRARESCGRGRRRAGRGAPAARRPRARRCTGSAAAASRPAIAATRAIISRHAQVVAAEHVGPAGRPRRSASTCPRATSRTSQNDAPPST